MTSEQVQSHIVVSPHYQAQVKLHSRLKKKQRREDIKTEKRRLEWTLVPESHMAISLHKDVGKLPAGVVLSVPREVALALISRRLAVPVGDSKVAPDAIIEDCNWADIGLA